MTPQGTDVKTEAGVMLAISQNHESDLALTPTFPNTQCWPSLRRVLGHKSWTSTQLLLQRLPCGTSQSTHGSLLPSGDLLYSPVPLPGTNHLPRQRFDPAWSNRGLDLPVHSQRK